MKKKTAIWMMIGFVLMFCTLGIADFFCFPAHAASETEKIRVGYFEYDGYHMQDNNGKRSGYGYDYLQYLGRYSNFTYEYIGYEKSWDDMLDMLENGEIDMLTSGRKSEDREKIFSFSEQPIGTSAAMLTVNAGDSRYLADDYTRLDGIRIGLLKGDNLEESLEDFARKNGFSYQTVYYDNNSELMAALHKGETIDATLTNSLRRLRNEWIIATFDIKPFYIMVRKDNSGLLDQVNKALSKLQRDIPNLPLTLLELYYPAESGDEIAFTAAERAYIKKLQEDGTPIRVTMNSGREPVSYFVDGEAKGIIPEIAKKVLGKTGIPYEFIDTPPVVDARDLLTGKEALVRFDGTSNFNDAESYGFRVTKPYLQLPLSCVTLKNFSGDPKSVAVIKNSDVVEEYVETVYDKADIIRYDSADACLDAVLTGKQDGAFFQTYIAQRFVNGDIRNRLKEQLVPGYGMSFSIAVSQNDTLLFSILDKAVLSMGSEEINHIVLEQTSYLSREGSLLGYLYDHPFLLLLLFAALASFIIILLLYIFRRKKLLLELEKNREFKRFITYVCKVYDNVLEINPSEKIYLSYLVEDGKVHGQEHTFDSADWHTWNIQPEDREYVEKLIQPENIVSLIEDSEEIYFECRLCSEQKPDTYQWYSVTLQGVPKDEQFPGKLMVFLKNIDQAKSEEKEKRQVLWDALSSARQAGEAKGTFMSRMSHEIRTPLNAIIGYLTIAKSSLQDPSKMEECLGKSEFAAHHLLSIINDVLDISAIESGKMKIACEAFNIRQLLSGISSIFHLQSTEKEVIFSVKLQGLTEERLKGDSLRLNQILMNLLSNAVKFTPSGGQVTFTVSQKALVEEKLYLQFEISDTGIGMSEEYKTRLFQPFEQQDAATAQKFGGTGLGLSITRNLVTMMGGTIDVASTEGSGTRFIVNLPFGLAEDSGNRTTELCDFSSIHALVLYSENSDYKYLQTILDRFGITYDIVFQQEEALQKISRAKEHGQEYDLFLLDWDIPGADNTGLLLQIKDSAAPHTPAVILIAFEEPALPECFGPINSTLLKPVFQSAIFDALSNLCRLRASKETPETPPEDMDLNGMRVLLAEDNPMNMEIAEEILHAYGLEVDSTVNGKEAVRQFEQSEEGTYQAILMDIQMPVMNGYEAARKIRSCKHPQAATIHIIALSADAFAEDINRALASGMNDHVSKPIDFHQLYRILSKCKTDSH